jgi:hypothetical protein
MLAGRSVILQVLLNRDLLDLKILTLASLYVSLAYWKIK